VGEGRAGRGGEPPVRVAVSACLLGHAVRYDGHHRRDPFVSGALGRCFELVAVCPEVAIGLGVPRAPIHLVEVAGEVRVRGVADPGLDVTEALRACAGEAAAGIEGLSGAVLKRGSPSCGLEEVEVERGAGVVAGRGAGAFAAALAAERPLLPREDEEGLADPRRRAGFVARVLIYHRWQRLRAGGLGAPAGPGAEEARRELLRALRPAARPGLARLLAGADPARLEGFAERYAGTLLAAHGAGPGRA